MSEGNVPRGGSFLIEDSEPRSIFAPEDFSEEQKMFAKTAEDFINNEVIPKIEETEAQVEGVMVELVKKAGELGLLMIDVPEKFGGLEFSTAGIMQVMECLGGIDITLATWVGQNNSLGIQPVARFGSDSIKKKWLPKLASGRSLISFALSEPGAGSHINAIAGSLRETEDGKFVLNANKQWIGNAAWST